jgi:SulP family sulfate permease
MVHSLTILGGVLVLAPLIGYLPMAALAALLLLVAWNISEVKHFSHILRVAPRSDALVLVTCFGLTVVFDMVIAVAVGVVLAALLFMRRMAEITHTRLTSELAGGDGGGAAGLPKELAKDVAIYEIAGPLFFGAAQKAMGSLGSIAGRLKVLIIRLESVPVMDATGLVALESALAALTKTGCVAILTGLQRQPAALLERAGIRHRPWRVMIRPDLPGAISAAEEVLGLATSSKSAKMTEIDLVPPTRS